MATDNPKKHTSADGTVITYVWHGLDNGDDGAIVKIPEFADKTVQVMGVFGSGGTVRIEGSCVVLDPTSTVAAPVYEAPSVDADWAVLNDAFGTALSLTAAGVHSITENPISIRPHVTAGDGDTDIDVMITVRRPTDKRQ